MGLVLMILAAIAALLNAVFKSLERGNADTIYGYFLGVVTCGALYIAWVQLPRYGFG